MKNVAGPALSSSSRFFETGAAGEERIRQFVNTDKQVAAHPEGGEPVVRLLDASGQGQRDAAKVLLGHHLRMLRQPTRIQQQRRFRPRWLGDVTAGSARRGRQARPGTVGGHPCSSRARGSIR
jgi:hypothetical protein